MARFNLSKLRKIIVQGVLSDLWAWEAGEPMPDYLRSETAQNARTGAKVREGGQAGRAKVHGTVLAHKAKSHALYVDKASQVYAKAVLNGKRLPNNGPITLHGLCKATAKQCGQGSYKTVERALREYATNNPAEFRERFAGFKMPVKRKCAEK